MFRRREDTRQTTPTRDPYRPAAKPAQPASCPRCGLVFRDGRWRRSALKPVPGGPLCPACLRAEGHDPAGELRVEGPFVAAHRADILATLHRVAEREGAGHPLERISEVWDEGDAIVVTTTGVHLARAMGQALRHAWDGELEIEDDDAVLGIRVRWRR